MSAIYIPNILLSVARNPITALGLPLGLGLLSGYPSGQVARSGWYENLATPPGRPPRQVFPIVWPVLYLAMGFASHVAVKAFDRAVSPASRYDISLGLVLYYAQLGLNLAWTPLFFGQKQIGAALIDSALMAGTTFYMTSVLDKPTGSATTYFLAPYCAWLAYATYLNGGIWWLNRGKPATKRNL